MEQKVENIITNQEHGSTGKCYFEKGQDSTQRFIIDLPYMTQEETHVLLMDSIRLRFIRDEQGTPRVYLRLGNIPIVYSSFFIHIDVNHAIRVLCRDSVGRKIINDKWFRFLWSGELQEINLPTNLQFIQHWTALSSGVKDWAKAKDIGYLVEA